MRFKKQKVVQQRKNSNLNERSKMTVMSSEPTDEQSKNKSTKNKKSYFFEFFLSSNTPKQHKTNRWIFCGATPTKNSLNQIQIKLFVIVCFFFFFFFFIFPMLKNIYFAGYTIRELS
jgi:hypothetical protein